jgi:phage/plasmid-like protein (TIGR03299 family)
MTTELLTASEVLLKHGLNFTVIGEPIYDNEGAELKDYKAILRQDNRNVFQVAKKGYEIVQNHESLSLLDEIVGSGMAKYSGARSYKNGAIVQILADVPMDYRIAGEEISTHLHVLTSHNGTHSTFIIGTNQRVLCQNVLNSKKNIWCKFKHTKNYRIKIDEAKQVFAHYRAVFQAQKEAFEYMASKQFNSLELDSFLNSLLNVVDIEETTTRTLNAKESIARLVSDGIGHRELKDTRWKIFNAVTEYVDHYRSTKGEESNREYASLLGSGAVLREKAYQLLTV